MWYSAVGCLITLALSMLVAPLAAVAQPPAKVPRIGWLSLAAPSANLYLLDAFRQGLRELGWVEGQNIAIESRYAEEKPDRLSDLAAELVRLKVDVILVGNAFAARAAQQATTELPIVMAGVGDVVRLGLVASLARPGGNITGLSEQYTDLVLKWLELLKEAVPQASRVGVLTMSTLWSVQGTSWQALQQAAKTMRVTLQRVEVRDPSEFESAFAGMTQEHCEALMVLPHPIFFRHRTRLVALAAESQLPTIWGPFKEFVDAGGLMAYGPSLRDQFRRAAYFVDKILKGATPADLPVEQPTKFELALNRKTAQVLGRIRKIKGLLALPRPHLASAPGAGEAVPAEGGERRRDALGDSRLGKSMATQEGIGAAVCATPSRRAQSLRDLLRWRQLRRPSHRWLGEDGQARWGVGPLQVSDGGGFCGSPRPA